MRTQAAKCEFGEIKDMMMLCRCAFGITNPRLKEKLLQDPEVTLNRAINLIRASEVTKSQLDNISGAKPTTIAAIEGKPKTSPTPTPRKTNCRFCSYEHIRGKCPAYGQTCRKCGQRNHFVKVCTNREVNSVNADATAGISDYFVGLIEGEGTEKSWFKEYELSKDKETTSVVFKLDTGAQANVLPLAVAKKIHANIEPSSTGLTSYSQHRIENVGRTKLTLSHSNTVMGEVWFELVETTLPPILGLLSCVSLGLVQRVDAVSPESIIAEFPDCFEGMGCLSREHKISIDPEVKPVVNRPRKVPLSMTDKTK